MHLKTLALHQFRSYLQQDLTLSPGLNLFVGPNGSGKSNLLEAVSVLATGQSHRGADAKHLAHWEKDELALQGRFEGEETLTLETRQKKGRPRRFLLNGHPQKRVRDWMGKVPVVSFSPDDLSLVKGEPAGRRRALNSALCQGDAAYWESLQRFNKILEERNAALRQIREGERAAVILDPWDISLLKEGAFLSLARQAFVEQFSPLVDRHHRDISSNKEKTTLQYKASFHLPEGGVEKVISANRERLKDIREGEIALGSTLVGPHRDDLELFVNGSPARVYASQGQQRTLALAFKLAERQYLQQRLGREPICLLDDVLSELDPPRRDNLAATLGRGAQCLATVTDAAEWPRAFTASGNDAVFKVRDSRVAPWIGEAPAVKEFVA